MLQGMRGQPRARAACAAADLFFSPVRIEVAMAGASTGAATCGRQVSACGTMRRVSSRRLLAPPQLGKSRRQGSPQSGRDSKQATGWATLLGPGWPFGSLVRRMEPCTHVGRET